MNFMYPIMASGLTAILVLFTDLSLGVSAAIGFLAAPLIGTIATLDDDLPGGWSNPDGDVKPPWSYAANWAPLLLGIAVTAAAFAVDVGPTSKVAIRLWFVSLLFLAFFGLLTWKTRGYMGEQRDNQGA